MRETLVRTLLLASLRRLVRIGHLTVRTADGVTHEFATRQAGGVAAFDLTTPQAERRLLFNPALALGELYMDGQLRARACPIYDVVALLIRNIASGGGHPIEAAIRRLRQPLRSVQQYNPVPRSRRNVAHHYDLDGRLYSLFLDKERFYSCAYFPTGRESLEEAQAAKVRHIAGKLRLDRPGLTVLDIGCGWGGLAIALARDWGARVTGITLSTEQLAVARQTAQAAGLADRVTFELIDYRDWSAATRAKVDRVVSVGMFEHVGIGHYDTFFRAVRDALAPDGIGLIHAIGRATGPGVTNAWIAKYIFPGGYCPALSEVLPVVEKSGLWAADIEVLRLHYAETLRHWRRRFAANRDTIGSIYDERFCRMFEFYLAACEATFRHDDHMVWQMQVSPSIDAVPITRDYITAAEHRQPAPVMAVSAD